MSENKNINVKVPIRDYEALEQLVKAGKFTSISDAVRTAVRDLLKRDDIQKLIFRGDSK